MATAPEKPARRRAKAAAVPAPDTGAETAVETVAAPLFRLQNILLPQLGPEIEAELYFRAHGPVAWLASERVAHIEPGAVLSFGTYFNAFSLGKWHDAGALDGLVLELSGAGQVELKVLLCDRHLMHVIHSDLLSFGKGPAQIDLSHYGNFSTRGVILVELRALGKAASVSGGAFYTRRQPETWPRLALSVTTFRREAAVGQTAARLDEFLARSEFGPHLHMFVVDNGQSLQLPPSPRITLIPNENLGGAGGFARGLTEAQAQGFTHCLFMDDDASCDTEALHRTYAFLALSKDPKTAVAGAMITATERWVMWENGAVFDGSCRPQFIGTDLRRQDQVVHIETVTADPYYRQRNPTLYGGWWYFAFPIAQVKHYPFPFFVRGDDISFSLANDFHINTLNGVVSFQDDFAAKESPQTLYLDLRNHLVHHLVFEALKRSPLGTARVALHFILRSLVRFHYESAEAQLLAWRDVMAGPDFFADNADMAARRAVLKEMTQEESWKPAATLDLKTKGPQHRSPRQQRLFSWLLNGHLIPFYSLFAAHVVVDISKRGALFPIWGASRITYLDSRAGRGYSVALSMGKFARILGQTAQLTWRFVREYDQLRASYKAGYDRITTRGFWQQKFGPAALAAADGQNPTDMKAKVQDAG